MIDELGMIQSFSAAVMECFFKYWKKEALDRRSYQTVEQLKQSMMTDISGFYNARRPYAHNNNFTCPLLPTITERLQVTQ